MFDGIKGVGPKTKELLMKIGINNINDLINYYPYRYNLIMRSDLRNTCDEEIVMVDGIIDSKPSVSFFGKMKRINLRLNVGYMLINVYIYNQLFLLKKLEVGTFITVRGRFNLTNNSITVNEVRFGQLDDKPKLEGAYHLVSGINRKSLIKLIDNALLSMREYDSDIPDYLEERYKFINKKDAINEIHHPSDKSNLKNAIVRLKYEELFIYMLRILYLKNKNLIVDDSIKRDIKLSDLNGLIDKIGFSLTTDQNVAINDILNDMNSGKRMNRLIQGDVGSGKTIVSFIALYINYLSHYQGALMAPTEILARQHYNNAVKLFDGMGVKIALLTASVKGRERDRLIEEIKNNEVDLIIGTHSLIQEKIIYHNLGLVVTDEQHRFGVNQRMSLFNKGIHPDILSMSATPIPRTFALTIYGDMDVTNIKTKPIGRIEVKTLVKLENEMTDVLKIMFTELKLGHQIYVVSPLIEEGEESNDGRESVVKLSEKMNKAFGKLYKIGILHGKLSNDEKKEIMENFEAGRINILISTTVIEVGVDVKNASMIVIFDADSFGLSTIHQLRGRVGRGDILSTCILITKKKTERLEILERSSDGFEISEYDFKTRGSGDLFGVRQSGVSYFKIADLRTDYRILMQARDDAQDFLSHSVNIDKYLKIKEKLDKVNEIT